MAQRYAEQVAAFNEHMRGRGIRDIDRYYWYHTIDLPGISTPGIYDFRGALSSFAFPADMTGMTALDVGSATGFFAFEFEKRGAEVISIELPSLEQLDRFPGQETSLLLQKMQQMIAPPALEGLDHLRHPYSAQELHYYLLDAPFRLCATLLGSRVGRRYSSIYDLSAERLGHAAFDLVFLGDVLLHTIRPFDALVTCAGLCRGSLIIAQTIPGRSDDPPGMAYVGGDRLAADDICWWLPNERCLREILSKLGFVRVEVVATHDGVLRPAGHSYHRTILRADRARVLNTK